MKLTGFRVTNFRSVEDSKWIDVDDVTSLIGINESGKSNLLIPLWKLNPAKGGEIHPIADFPRSRFNVIRAQTEKPTFIHAHFATSESLAIELAKLTGLEKENFETVSVKRDLGGTYNVDFPFAKVPRETKASTMVEIIDTAISEITKLEAAIKAEDPIKTAIVEALQKSRENTISNANIDKKIFENIRNTLSSVKLDGLGKHSTIGPRFLQLIDAIKEIEETISLPDPDDNDKATDLVLDHLPKFVYYHNYGNLDSEIYLPHVIDNMSRNNLGQKEEAKARTLKVLFDFVQLKPNEILDLGTEAPQDAPKEAIEKVAEKKRERDILLQSASTSLTNSFREWWKQGDYRFRLAADGKHFRIWVSDDKRPEDIELEGRSTGLQWFLSFFLVFLVESDDSHADAILLLDEPGLTLHALAQKDLSSFFDSLSKKNQIIFSSHSLHLIESDKLDRVRAVYLDDSGKTVVTSDLRSAAPKSVQEKSIYAAHAALGLTVSDVILQGCLPVIVEGQSDQYYFTAIKNFLISTGQFQPSKEIVFMSGGGTRAIRAVASIISAKAEDLPPVFLDSDQPGKTLAKKLKEELYAAQSQKVVLIGELLNRDNVEVEDLIPASVLATVFSKLYRGADNDFSDAVNTEKPILPQMEAFAKENGFELVHGWKVELAKLFKKRIAADPKLMTNNDDLIKAWIKIFEKMDAPSPVLVKKAEGKSMIRQEAQPSP